jgi:hypothetical protein
MHCLRLTTQVVQVIKMGFLWKTCQKWQFLPSKVGRIAG